MKKAWIGASAALTTALFVLAACSSSNNGGSTSGDSSCVASLASNLPTCAACIESSCPSQVTTAESGCSDLLKCVCPNGTYESSALAFCSLSAGEPGCSPATQAVESCASAKCATQCGADAGS